MHTCPYTHTHFGMLCKSVAGIKSDMTSILFHFVRGQQLLSGPCNPLFLRLALHREKKTTHRWDEIPMRTNVWALPSNHSQTHTLYIAPNIANWCSAMTVMPIGAFKVYLTWYLTLKFKDVFVWLFDLHNVPQRESFFTTVDVLQLVLGCFPIPRNSENDFNEFVGLSFLPHACSSWVKN